MESCKKRILNEENDAQSSVRYGGSLGVVFLPQFFGAKVEEKRREPSEKRVGLPLLICYNGAKSRKGDGTVKTVLIADDEPVMRMDL